MSGEEVFDHGEIELRVHEDGAKICLEHIWETLESYTRQLGEFSCNPLGGNYLRRIPGGKPVVHRPVALSLCELDIFGVVSDLPL